MSPKIMFRIFFSQVRDAQNDNVAVATMPHETPMPSFFGSRLSYAASGHHGAVAPSPAGAASRRHRLQVIEGDMAAEIAAAAQQRPAEDGNRL